jgi:hypothetical protein
MTLAMDSMAVLESRKALARNNTALMQYAIMMWITFCQPARDYVGSTEPESSFSRFVRILHRFNLRLLHGKTPRGNDFTEGMAYFDVLRKLPMMVLCMQCVYSHL